MPHTPGPWKFDTEDGCILTGNDAIVAAAFLDGLGINWRQQEDGRLAAAAPELAGALKLIVYHFGDPLKVARAALDKAGVEHD